MSADKHKVKDRAMKLAARVSRMRDHRMQFNPAAARRGYGLTIHSKEVRWLVTRGLARIERTGGHYAGRGNWAKITHLVVEV